MTRAPTMLWCAIELLWKRQICSHNVLDYCIYISTHNASWCVHCNVKTPIIRERCLLYIITWIPTHSMFKPLYLGMKGTVTTSVYQIMKWGHSILMSALCTLGDDTLSRREGISTLNTHSSECNKTKQICTCVLLNYLHKNVHNRWWHCIAHKGSATFWLIWNCAPLNPIGPGSQMPALVKQLETKSYSAHVGSA